MNKVLLNALKMIADRQQHQPSTKAEDYIKPSTDLHDLFYDGFNVGQVVANNACVEIAQKALDSYDNLRKFTTQHCVDSWRSLAETVETSENIATSDLVQVIDPHTGEYLYFPKS